ncbi:hypothetical protein J4449_00740 [Candidatus Woesearchaeota archaeon]|nr:hypothetical protein [Candidatus Woesearchaeota archaeon]
MVINKKGFIRTIEAVIAIVILLGLVLTIFGDKPQEIKKRPEVVESSLNYITNEILYNKEFRNCFLSASVGNNGGLCSSKLSGTCWGDPTKIKEFINLATPPGYENHCEVCKTTRSCSKVIAPEDKSVYPKSVFLYLSKEDEARIVRIYLFEKA